MNQQPEKLFRDKLQNYQPQVPAGAWGRIENRLDKKNDRALYLKIAASLIFIIASGIVVWQWNSNRANATLLSEKKNVESKTEGPKKSNAAPSAVVTPKPGAKSTVKTIEKKKVAPKKAVQPIIKNDAIVADHSVAKVEEEIPAPIQRIIESNETILENPIVATDPIVTQNSIEPKKEDEKVKIVFSVQEVDEKYLDKKALAEATSDNKKPSTFRKLLDKANDLTTNQEVFGDLRQKKNEILALNFKSEKRSQNK